VNTDAATLSTQVSPWRDLDSLLEWLTAHGAIDEERAGGISRRAILQPAAAAATLVDARRVRSALRLLAEKGGQSERVVDDVLAEINRVLGRSAGTRRLDRQPDGQYQRSFVPTGDAFAGLMIPVVESAADTLVAGDIRRVRRCAEPRCHRVFLDTTRNGQRRWCDMGTCGNRAKAARHRAKGLTPPPRERPRARG
jgi:predicted RNA-binding Zn ribbon-like protein